MGIVSIASWNRRARFLPVAVLLTACAGSTHEAAARQTAAPAARRARVAAVKVAGKSNAPTQSEKSEAVTVDVLSGIKNGQLEAAAEGTGDGGMTLTLRNRSRQRLRVVLPPGLVASGASGQFGGMGGMGGGMGGMGGMGGGMGGMGGGMGGGMMGRGGMGGGTMPASMGMMMLGQLIMRVVGDRDSWDVSSLMAGGMGGMGGMGMGGMGGMGGGMGGMGGMGGGMGGGFRSVPPTGGFETTLQPGQERRLPTPLVNLKSPNPGVPTTFPAKGEALEITDVDRVTDDARTRFALRRLAASKAPRSVAQMVLWSVAGRVEWELVGTNARGWANESEFALAKEFVEGIDAIRSDVAPEKRDEPGVIYWEAKSDVASGKELVEGFRSQWNRRTVLGLKTVEGVPKSSDRTALACSIEIKEKSVEVRVSGTNSAAKKWVPLGKFVVASSEFDKAPESAAAETSDKSAPRPEITRATRLADSVALGMLGRLVRADLVKGPKSQGKETYQLKVVNISPFILEGVALAGSSGDATTEPAVVAGLSLSPFKSLALPASPNAVTRLHLKDGVRVVAADLSGL